MSSVERRQALLEVLRRRRFDTYANIVTIRVGKKYIIPKASVIDFLGLNHAAKPSIINSSGKACESLERSK